MSNKKNKNGYFVLEVCFAHMYEVMTFKWVCSQQSVILRAQSMQLCRCTANISKF